MPNNLFYFYNTSAKKINYERICYRLNGLRAGPWYNSRNHAGTVINDNVNL